MPEEQRRVFQQMADQDKFRYKQEKDQYDNMLRATLNSDEIGEEGAASVQPPAIANQQYPNANYGAMPMNQLKSMQSRGPQTKIQKAYHPTHMVSGIASGIPNGMQMANGVPVQAIHPGLAYTMGKHPQAHAIPAINPNMNPSHLNRKNTQNLNSFPTLTTQNYQTKSTAPSRRLDSKGGNISHHYQQHLQQQQQQVYQMQLQQQQQQQKLYSKPGFAHPSKSSKSNNRKSKLDSKGSSNSLQRKGSDQNISSKNGVQNGMHRNESSGSLTRVGSGTSALFMLPQMAIPRVPSYTMLHPLDFGP